MAGYLFNLDSEYSLALYAKSGVYATKMSDPSRSWRAHHEGTFADYATMQAGDNVYFFIGRKIYGIGRLVNLGGDCKFFNFPGAAKPRKASYQDIRRDLLWDEGPVSKGQRCVCLFEPDPHFFTTGVDMDDVLSSNPSAFRMLRAFWKVSFIKFDDAENQAFRDIVLKRNERVLVRAKRGRGVFPFRPTHRRMLVRLSKGGYALGAGISVVLRSCSDGDYVGHEMALEAGILQQLSAREPRTCAVLGEWDYLSHQVVASPFKPIDYMEKMDVFGYSYVPGFKPTRARFLVGEIKKDAASVESVDQVVRYVDWVKDEYSFGDYSMISAFLAAYEFAPDVVMHARRVGVRRYMAGVRPARSLEWRDLKLLRYSFDSASGRVDLGVVK